MDVLPKKTPLKHLPIQKILVYLSNGDVKRIEGKEAFYKEERLETEDGPVLLVDCFLAVASVTDIPTGKK